MSEVSRRRGAAFACAALAASLVVPVGAQAAPKTLASVSGAASAKTVDVCGAARSAGSAAPGASLTARARRAGKAFRGVLVLERCENGRWVAGKRLGRRSVTFQAPADGDYRLRVLGARGARVAYLRTGVGEIVDLPFKKKVNLTNRTFSFCQPTEAGPPPPDKAYTVSGHLTGPRAALEAKDPAVTIYYHGLSYGEFFWRFKDVPGYDTTTELAKAGHVSLTVDRLGYGASSGELAGTGVCYGIQADIAKQLSLALRQGGYDIDLHGADAVPFGKVALVGHSAGAFIAEIAKYSFPDDFEALGMLGYGDATTSPTAVGAVGIANLDCLAGGSQQDADGPGGYAFFGRTEADFRAAHLNAPTDPAVADAVAARRAKDPCGDLISIGPALLVNQLGASLVSGPVLLLSGAQDVLFPPPAVDFQQARMINADVTAQTLPDTGHALLLGNSAPKVREILSGFLKKNGF